MVSPENQKSIKALKYIFYAGLVISVLSDLFVHREKIEFFWDAVPGFNALYGFLSSILLITVSLAGYRLLAKREDYYD